MTRSLLLLLTFAGGLLVGWLGMRGELSSRPPGTPLVDSLPRAPQTPDLASSGWRRLSLALDQIPSSGQRRFRLLAVLSEAGPEDLAALLTLLHEQDRELIPLLIQHWVDREPAAFAAALEQTTARMEERLDWTQGFYRAWAAKEAEPALARARHAIPDLRSDATNAVIEGTFDVDPGLALTLSGQIPGVMIDFAADKWAREKSTQVLERLDTIQQLPPSRLRDRVLSRAAMHLAKTDVAAALALAERQDSLTQAAVRGSVAHGWAEANPADARRYVETSEPGPFRAEVATILGLTLAGRDPAAAVPWAMQWMTGIQRQFVLQRSLAALEKNDPAQAAALRETVPRPLPPPPAWFKEFFGQ